MHCLRNEILPSGLCAKICTAIVKRGGGGFSGKIGTFSGPFQVHFVTLIVILIKMLRGVVKKNNGLFTVRLTVRVDPPPLTVRVS